MTASLQRQGLLFSSPLTSLLIGISWQGLSPFPSFLKLVPCAKINSWNPTSLCFLMFCTVTIVWDTLYILFFLKLIKPVFLAFAAQFYWIEYLLLCLLPQLGCINLKAAIHEIFLFFQRSEISLLWVTKQHFYSFIWLYILPLISNKLCC